MITVRHERAEDQIGIQEVDTAATATLRRTYLPNQRALTDKARISIHLRRLVAIIEGRIVGTVQYCVENEAVRVIGLGVHPEFRRRGVARSMIQSIEEIGAKGEVSWLYLHTIKETGNVETFKRLGFTVISEQEDEFSESVRFEKLTGVEMAKRISLQIVHTANVI